VEPGLAWVASKTWTTPVSASVVQAWCTDDLDNVAWRYSAGVTLVLRWAAWTPRKTLAFATKVQLYGNFVNIVD
jgi:hypothetical protein